jgi:hypothetical protein
LGYFCLCLPTFCVVGSEGDIFKNRDPALAAERLKVFLEGIVDSTEEEQLFQQHIGFDWRKQGMALAVKDQKRSSSCLSHAITSALEGHLFIHLQGVQTRWSALDLYFCIANQTARSNLVGVIHDAAQVAITSTDCLHTRTLSVMKQKGCSARKLCHKPRALIQKYYLNHQNKFDIMHRIRRFGPVVALMDWSDAVTEYGHRAASGKINHFVFYGKDFPELHGRTSGSHAVLLIGYGFDNGTLYWIVQNSHGKDSGYDGIFYIAHGEGELGKQQVLSLHQVELVQA